MNLDLGIVSDEISPDFKEAIRYGTEWGLSIYELRVLRSGRVPAVDPEEFREVLTLVKNRGLTVSALSPGIFKHQLSKKQEILAELKETLPRSLDMAEKLGTKLMIVFGFQRETGEPESRVHDWLEYMRKASEISAKAGIRLAIENEPGFWADSGFNTAALIRRVGMPNLGANWDPCNGYGTAELPYPDGYEAVKGVTFNVHVKDTLKGSLIQCVPVGEGAIDWKGQIAAIVRDKVVKHVTIETHCLPLIENSKKNIDLLRSYLHQT